MNASADEPPLLANDEPAPFEIVDRRGRSPLLFVCDHASNRIPRSLGGLGLSASARADHIAWDIGALDVARRLAHALGGTLIATAYSRLVIDCNRRLQDPSCIAAESDGIAVPGNRGLTPAQRRARADLLYHPYHRAIRDLLTEKAAAHPSVVFASIHSFTPVFQTFRRPWHIGILWNRDESLAAPMMQALRRNSEIVVGENEPYSARDEVGYTIVEHAERAGRPHLMIEIRQDLIDTAAGAARWAAILGNAIAEACAAAGVSLDAVGEPARGS
jgi:predicted N-formylglutamate amidohydrolase